MKQTITIGLVLSAVIGLVLGSASHLSAQAILVGDPASLVQTSASITFDPADGAYTIPQRGWYNVMIFARTNYTNGAQMDCEAWLPFYSLLNPNAAETPPPEGKIMVGTVCVLVAPGVNSAFFGNQVTEVRTQLPLYTQLTTSYTQAAFGYNYQSFLPTGIYQALVNPNLHMGVPGVLIPGTILDGTNGHPIGTGNLDPIDPAFLATVPPKMGNAPGDVTLAINWIETVPAGFVDQWGGHPQAGTDFETWLNFNVHLNPVTALSGPTFTIHNNPWGISTVSQNACPTLDFQGHYSPDAGPPLTTDPPDTLVHDLAHSHITPTACVYAETPGGQSVTIPFVLKLFHTSGQISIVQASFMGPNGPVAIPVTLGAAPPPPPPPPPVQMWVTIATAPDGASLQQLQDSVQGFLNQWRAVDPSGTPGQPVQ